MELRNLTIEGTIAVFKSLAISKLIHFALFSEIPTSINLLTRMEMEFMWKEKSPEIKNSTFWNDYENGGLKIVDTFLKVVSLKFFLIKRLFDNNFHQC